MKITYKCACQAKPIEIDAPDRRPAGELDDWFNTIAACVSMDHRALNSKCQRLTMEYVKIPHASEGAQVGVPVTKQ